MQRKRERHGHGALGKRERGYSCWNNMIGRCYNNNDYRYEAYGGSGIIVCDRWKNSFLNFISDMGERPSQKHSIDRYPNKQGNYEPGNCRWATSKEQNANRNNNVLYTHNGITKIQEEWARELGISSDTINYHLKNKSFSEIVNHFTNCERSRQYKQTRNKTQFRLIEYNGVTKSLTDWSKEFCTHYSNLSHMLSKKTFEEAYNFYKSDRSKTIYISPDSVALPLPKWAKKFNINESTLRYQIKKYPFIELYNRYMNINIA